MMRRQIHHRQDCQSKIFYELSALVLDAIRSPMSAVDFSDNFPEAHRRPPPLSLQQMTPAGLASLLLGISLTLMLCGSITFLIGFVLMPWVFVLVMFAYFVGVISSISLIGRAFLCHKSSSLSPRNVHSWRML